MLSIKLLLLYLFPVLILIPYNCLIGYVYAVDNGFNNKLLVSYSNWKEPLLVFVALR